MVLWSVWLSGVRSYGGWSCVLCAWGLESKFTKHWSGAFVSALVPPSCVHLRITGTIYIMCVYPNRMATEFFFGGGSVVIRSVQSTENRKFLMTDLCVISYGPTLTVNLISGKQKEWTRSLLISPTRYLVRYPRLGIITSRGRLPFWCRYNEEFCS